MTPEIHMPRETTVVVAASDSLTASADYKCDGTADEVQINLATAAVHAAGGGTVKLLEGTFTLADKITSYNTVDLIGQGYKSTILDNGNETAANSIEVDGGAGHSMGGRIAHMQIMGNASSGAGILLYRTHHFYVDNVFIGDESGTHGTYGIDLNNAYATTIRDGAIYLVGTKGLYAHASTLTLTLENFIISANGEEDVYLDAVEVFRIRDNHFESTDAYEDEMIYLNGACLEGWIEDNMFVTNAAWDTDTDLIKVVGGSGTEAYFIHIDKNTHLTGKSRSLVDMNQYTWGCTVNGNKYSGTIAGTPFYIAGVGHEIAGNQISITSEYGIYLANATACDVHDNYGLNVFDALVFLASTCLYCKVHNNIAYWTNTEGPSVYGIDCDAPGTSITDNYLVANATKGWTEGIHINADDCKVSDNYIVYAGVGIYGQDGDDCQISNNVIKLSTTPIDVDRADMVRPQIQGNNWEGCTNDAATGDATDERIHANIDKTGAWWGTGDTPA